MRKTLGFCRSTSVAPMKTTHFSPNRAQTVAVATPCWPGAGLGDDPGLAHAPRQQDLPEHVVDLVRPGVVQLVALEVDLRAAEPLGQPLGEIERRRTPDIVLPQVVHLGPEVRCRSWPARTAPRARGSAASASRRRSARRNRRNGRARPGRCGRSSASAGSSGPPRVRGRSTARSLPRRGRRPSLSSAPPRALPSRAATKARTRSGSLNPGRLSTPDDTSTCSAPDSRTASATLSGVSPPASIHGRFQRRPAISRQSNAWPLPPGRSAPRGGRASTRIWSATLGIGVDLHQVRLARDPDRLHHRPPEPRPHLGDPLGRLPPVQLEHVDRHRREQRFERLVAGIDGQRHPDHPLRHAGRDPAGIGRASGAAARAGRRPSRCRPRRPRRREPPRLATGPRRSSPASSTARAAPALRRRPCRIACGAGRPRG